MSPFDSTIDGQSFFFLIGKVLFRHKPRSASARAFQGSMGAPGFWMSGWGRPGWPLSPGWWSELGQRCKTEMSPSRM